MCTGTAARKRSAQLALVLALALGVVAVGTAGGLKSFFKNPVKTIANAPGKLVEHVFFRSTIEGFGSVANDAAGNAIRGLDAVLTKHSAEIDKKIVDLKDITDESIKQLSGEGDRLVEQLQKESDLFLEQLREASKDFVTIFDTSMRKNLLMGAALLVLVICIGFLLLAMKVSEEPARVRLLTAVALVLVLTIIATSSYWVLNDDCSDSRALMAKAKQGYLDSYESYRFDRARSYASVMESLESTCNPPPAITANMLARKMRLLTKTLFNPWSYKDGARLDTTKAELAALQKEFEAATSFPDGDLAAVQAMIYWLTATFRDGEFYAASLAAEVLENLENRLVPDGWSTAEGGIPRPQWREHFVLAPLATQVLGNYLHRPLTEAELDVVARNPSVDGQPYSEVIAQWSNVQASMAALYEEHPLPPSDPLAFDLFGTYEQYARRFERDVVPAYVCAVHYSSMIGYGGLRSGTDQARWEKKRTECLDRIQAAFEGAKDDSAWSFVQFMSQRDFDGTTIRFAALAGPHAIHSRGLALNKVKPSSAVVSPPLLRACIGSGLGAAICKAQNKKLQDDYQNSLSKKRGTIVPANDPKALESNPAVKLYDDALAGVMPGNYSRKRFKAEIIANLQRETDLLADFETKYADLIESLAFSESEEIQKKATAALRAAGALGLFVCERENFDCNNYLAHTGDPLVVPAVTFITDVLKRVAPEKKIDLTSNPGLINSAQVRRRWLL